MPKAILPLSRQERQFDQDNFNLSIIKLCQYFFLINLVIKIKCKKIEIEFLLPIYYLVL